MRQIAVSIDTDDLALYRQIHGLSPTTEAARVVFERALPRALDWAESLGLRLSLFVITSALDRASARSSLSDALRRGHELESHSQSHRYDLSRLAPRAIERELKTSFDALAQFSGAPPLGFRAPGYVVSAALFDALEQVGYRFDSSVFPSPAYYLLKHAVIAGMRVSGKRTLSLATGPDVLFSPTQPYRPAHNPHRVGDRALWELPIGVSPWLRLPWIGTSVGLLGTRLLSLGRWAERQPLCHLSLHAIDFLAASEVGASLAGLPEVRVPLDKRTAAFSEFVRAALEQGREVTTLRGLAAQLELTSPCT